MKKTETKPSWPLIGNRHIVEFLGRSIANNNIVSAYIFAGPDNLGKATVANYFAMSLVCQNKESGNIAATVLPCGQCPTCKQIKSSIHGDIFMVKRESGKKEISIEQIRELIRQLSMSSFFNSYKIGIVRDAESLSAKAANALLKILEEPNLKVVVILITANLDLMPATIKSRSQILRFHPVKADVIHDYLVKEHKTSRSAAKDISRLCLGRPALAVKFYEDKDFFQSYQNRVMVFLNFGRQDINGRLAGIDGLVGGEARGQDAARQALRIVEIWQGVLRDLLLLELSQEDLIQHQIFYQELVELKSKFNQIKLIDIAKSLKQAREFIRANVNAKLALETVAVNM